MRIADIKYPDIANGNGIRVSLFLQGCSRHCKGCFNKETWDFKGGREFTEEDKQYIFDKLDKSQIMGLSVLGGEPLEQSEELEVFLQEVKNRHPSKTIWLYTGNTYEDVKDMSIMKYIDVIIDGEFIEDKKDLRLSFRGSSNQRVINLTERW